MKFWKGRIGTPKEGQYGTMADSGVNVPDSDIATEAEYNAWLTAQNIIPAPDYPALYAAASTDAQRINIIAQALKLV